MSVTDEANACSGPDARQLGRDSDRSEATMTPATKALEKAGINFKILAYEHDPRSEAYGLEAVTALKLDAQTVFKTLLVEIEPAELATAIIPVNQRLNLKAVAKALGAKRAHMAPPRAAERATGYVLGGISPFGGKTKLPIYAEATLRELPTLFINGGRRGLLLELAPRTLETCLEMQSVSVAI